jgi:flagellin
MRIQHNIMAMNAYRNYSTNTSALSKNLEKLSSGYRINRAGDDAAGLAISEKMRAQISGLEQASNNVKDGISLVQTAEGALQEVQDMLNRMVTLSEESANGTYQDDVDRDNLQSEMDALKEEINRIADSANFNGINLLDGSLSNGAGLASADDLVVKLDGTETKGSAATVAAATFKHSFTVTATGTGTQTMKLTYLDANGNAQTASFSYSAGTSKTSTAKNLAAEMQKVFTNYTVSASASKVTITAKAKGEDKTQLVRAEINGATSGTIGTLTAGKDQVAKSADLTAAVAKNKNYITIGDNKYQIVTRGTQADAGYKALYVDASGTGVVGADGLKQIASQLKGAGYDVSVDSTGKLLQFNVSSDGSSGSALTLQIGDTSNSWNQMTVSISDMHTSSMGIEGLSVANQSSAAAAISVIKDAINYVSSTRGTLGATQNRLEHTSNNLSVMTENIQDAESTIRDTDIADEMTAYTKNQILVQSAQAMLAQANSVPQGVLQLLQ